MKYNYKFSDDDYEDEAEEFRKFKHKYIRCSDRMCGAEDCPTCHPEILMEQPNKESLDE